MYMFPPGSSHLRWIETVVLPNLFPNGEGPATHVTPAPEATPEAVDAIGHNYAAYKHELGALADKRWLAPWPARRGCDLSRSLRLV